MAAKRDNKDKPDLSLLPAKACFEEARVWGFGAEKYGRSNWRKLWGDSTVDVVMASLLRHAFAILDGELTDKESGLSHAAHIRCNAAMIIEYEEVLRTSPLNVPGEKL
jgi:hypothetical protein